MNRKQAEDAVGGYVKWDWWSFVENNIHVEGIGVAHHSQCVGQIWYLMKFTKGGMCQISREIDGKRFTVSVPPSVLSVFEYPKGAWRELK